MDTELAGHGETPEISGCAHLLRTCTHSAVVGFSANPHRPGHFVAAYLQAEGYDLVLVNPRYAGQILLGRRISACLREAREAGEQIEIVNVFRRPQDLEPVLQEALAATGYSQRGDRAAVCIQDRCIKTCRASLRRVDACARAE